MANKPTIFPKVVPIEIAALMKATKDLLSDEQSITVGYFGTNTSKLHFRSGVRLKSHHRRLIAKFDYKLRAAYKAMEEVYKETFATEN